MRTLEFFGVVAAMVLFSSAAAAANFTYDLGVANADITFSKGTLVAGDTVRIYGRVTNWGSKDISGYVTFYQGEQLVGNSQVVTVRPNASYDDVWVDFLVPQGSFNIRAEIKGTSPQDENPANDLALSPMFTPLADSDGDLIADTQDNCKDIANADQRDADADGKGDVCDPYPNDATNTPPAPPAPVVSPASETPASGGTASSGSLQPAAEKPSTPAVSPSAKTPAAKTPTASAPDPAVEDDATSMPADTGIDGAVEGASTTLSVAPQTAGEGPIGISGATSVNDISVETKRLNWNTYRFRVLGADSSQGFIAWQTSDGASGTGESFTHVFPGSGSYAVGVTMTTVDGNTLQGPTLQLAISFFHFGNWKLWAALFAGGCLVATVVWLLLRRGSKD